jgi:4-hydroxy-tetrahydrodipicolinate reductase
MFNIILIGANGKMGQVVAALSVKTTDIKIVAGVDKITSNMPNGFPVYSSINEVKEDADIIIDFSRPDTLQLNTTFAKQKSIPLVIATTGFSLEEKELINEASKTIPIFLSANMSLGVNLQMELAKTAAGFLGEAYDIEIIEKHHNQKVDSPSGTALALAECINDAFPEPKEYMFGRNTKTQKRGKEIGFHSIRGGTITGEHTVMFIGSDEIIEISHIAQSRQILAFGALRAARFMAGKPAGLYNMSDIFNQSAITHIYQDDDQAMITMAGMPFSPSAIADIFSGIAEKNIKIDIISQTSPYDGKVSLSFSLPHSDIGECVKAIKKHAYGTTKIITDESLTKLTVEGAGMQRQSGVASKLFGALAEKDIGIYIITTSETKISFCVNTNNAKDAVAVVSEAFSLK